MEPENPADTPNIAGALPPAPELPSHPEPDPTTHLESEVSSHSSPRDEEFASAENSPDTEANSSERVSAAASAPCPPEPDSLEYFAQRSLHARLSAEEETQAVARLQDLLLGGRSDVARALQGILMLPWMVSAQGTTRAWPEMKPTFRSQLLAGLARTPGEPAARVRLSLARALFKVDPTASIKLILLTLKVLRNKENGLLQGRGPGILSNVLIGKGKAWLLQLPMEALKPAEIDLLVFSALHGAFHAPLPPLTQIGILRWAAKCERLAKLPTALEQLILRSIQRWSGKWQSVLRGEVQTLPDAWYSHMKIGAPSVPGPARHEEETDEPHPEGSPKAQSEEESKPSRRGNNAGSRKARKTEIPEEDQENHRPLEAGEVEDRTGDSEGEASTSWEDTDEEREPEDFSREEDGDTEEESEEEEKDALPPVQKQRPVYQSKTVPRPGAAGPIEPDRAGPHRRYAAFNLQDALRQIESYTAGLKSELAAAQKQLRQREVDRRGRRIEKPAPIPGEPSVEELNRLNQQLEFRNAELSARIEELLIDSEQRAASRNLAATDSDLPDPASELRALLGLKLREDFEDFQALEQEKKDLVVQQHYRSLLRHIFEVLSGEGVSFSLPPSET